MSDVRKIFKDIVFGYLTIGFIIGLSAWLIDSTSGLNTIVIVPIIMMIWPLWLFILIAFGS